MKPALLLVPLLAFAMTLPGTSRAQTPDPLDVPPPEPSFPLIDHLFDDLNHNGARDEGEPAISGATVVLADCAGRALASATTGTDGFFYFDFAPGALPMDVRLELADLASFVHPCGRAGAFGPDGASVCFTMTSEGGMMLKLGESIVRPAAIGDRVWEDSNGNGVQDSGEPGLPGVKVQLRTAAGVVVATTNTSAHGRYLFSALRAGLYRVRFFAPTGFIFTVQHATTNAFDSDARRTNGFTRVIALGTNEINLTIDAGLRRPMGFVTHTHGGWGQPAHGKNIGAFLARNYTNVFGHAGVTIGGSNSLHFTDARAIARFLPAPGRIGTLRRSRENPLRTEAGMFAGRVLSLKLNIAFSTHGITPVGLGDLKVAAYHPFAGHTVAQVLALADEVLGGDTAALPAGFSLADLSHLVHAINANFSGGHCDLGLLTY